MGLYREADSESLEGLLINAELPPYDELIREREWLKRLAAAFFDNPEIKHVFPVNYVVYQVILESDEEMYVKKGWKNERCPHRLWEALGMELNNLLTDQQIRYLYNGNYIVMEGVPGTEIWTHPPPDVIDVRHYAFAYGKWEEYSQMLLLSDRPPNIMWDGSQLRNIDLESVFTSEDMEYAPLSVVLAPHTLEIERGRNEARRIIKENLARNSPRLHELEQAYAVALRKGILCHEERGLFSSKDIRALGYSPSAPAGRIEDAVGLLIKRYS